MYPAETALLLFRNSPGGSPEASEGRAPSRPQPAYPSVCNAARISSRMAGSSIVAGILKSSPSAILTMVARRILPDRVLGRRLTTSACLKAATGPIWSRTSLTHSALISASGRLVRNADHGAFGNVRVAGQYLFHCASGQAMVRDVYDVVGPGHDVEIPVLIHISGVACFIVAREVVQVALLEPVFRVPKRRKCAWRQGKLDGDSAEFTRFQWVSTFVENLHVIARHRHRGRAELDRQLLDAHRIRSDGPACLRLPPVIDNGYVQHPLRPLDGVRIGPLPRQKQGLQR